MNPRRLLLPGPLPVRLALWLVILVAFPLSGTTALLSLQLEVLGCTTFAAVLPEEDQAQVGRTESVLQYLSEAEKKETDPWRRDDYRIAWITTLWSQKGVPEWSWHRDSPPYVAATYQVLRCHPDQVWPRIVAQRKLKLGSAYASFFPAAAADEQSRLPLPAKKPCASERQVRRREKNSDSGERLAA